MIIYGELLFAENMIIGGVLLYITAMIHGKTVVTSKERLRLLAGSVMCGAFSMVIFLDVKVHLLLLSEILFAGTVCIAVFGLEEKSGGALGRIPWKYALTFVLVTYFMGGITMGLLLVTDNTGVYTTAGVYTGDMKAGILALLIWLGYITALRVIKIVRDKKLYTEHSYEVCIVFGDEKFRVRAFFDTGNHLKEPITGRPVAVASEGLWKRMQIRKPSDFRFAMIPYETVGAKGMLEAVRVDHIEIGTRRIKGCFVAGSDGSFSVGKHEDEGEGYDLLISAEMVRSGL